MPSPQQTNSHCMPKRWVNNTPLRLTAHAAWRNEKRLLCTNDKERPKVPAQKERPQVPQKERPQVPTTEAPMFWQRQRAGRI